MTRPMGTASTPTLTVRATKETGWTTSNTVREKKAGPMVLSTKENIWQARSTVGASTDGTTAASMKVNGLKTNIGMAN